MSVDAAARAVVDIINSGSEERYLHLVHPRPVPWHSIIEPMAGLLCLPLVPYVEWVSRLQQSREGLSATEEVESMQMNPALKIVDTFLEGKVAMETSMSTEAMGLPQLEVTKAAKASPSLTPDQLPQQTAGDALRWITYWKDIGFLC